MREHNIAILQDTLDVCERGFYETETGRVDLKLDMEHMLIAEVYEPRVLDGFRSIKEFNHPNLKGRCSYSVVNTDSFTLAREIAENNPDDEVLVLNLANPVHIGGGVRRGAKAQEEDLCRQSTLLLALEGEDSSWYYEYNRSLHTRKGSDAVIIIPEVEIFKDADYNYLDHTTIVSVITCAAPILDFGVSYDKGKYRNMMYHRIEGILVAAAVNGYRRLVLGAFGCGAFNNDAAIVSDIFYDVIRNFSLDGAGVDDYFKSIDFAVLTRPGKTYNYDEFARNFNDFYGVKREPLKPVVAENQHPEFIGFWHEYDEYGCLSNWYKAGFEYAGKHFASVEQFMMYHKLMSFRQYDLADQVMRTDDPAEAKKIGRTHFDNFDDKLWTRISSTIVKRGVRAKFVQNPDLMRELLATGNAVLAECSPYDKVWGIGLAPDDERVYDTRKWDGKNKLGRILMTLREEFRNWNADASKGKLEYIDAYDLPEIPEWKLNTGMLKMIPQYHDTIDAYSATLKGPEIDFFYTITFADFEFAMRTNMGGGMPVIGFYEMKQDIYDIARRM